METNLAPWIRDTTAGQTAERVLRSCVHCGFCTATCPTYQLLGDELDGPRGRIYLIKEVLEGAPATRTVQQHLDRCLTCLGCETTCPSGVDYRQLLAVGREVVEAQVRRPWTERCVRWVLREGLTRPGLFGAALSVGRALALALPATWRQKMGRSRPAGVWPEAGTLARSAGNTPPRQVFVLRGCTQPALAPAIDSATARVLAAIGVTAVVAPRAGCCGAVQYHLGDPSGALQAARRNIDAWWPQLASGEVEALVVNASGCGLQVKDYGQLLHDDPLYADKARQVSAQTRDPAEFLLAERAALLKRVGPVPAQRVVFHPPCSLQHGQKIHGVVEALLTALGAELLPVNDAHLCCGSAGAYSLLQPGISTALRDGKLAALQAAHPQMILSANIGCLAHLETGTTLPVRHWLEWVDAALHSRSVIPSDMLESL